MVMFHLFKLHDTYGFPLTDSIIECRKRDLVPSIPAFVCDALLAGWKLEKAIDKVKESYRDLGEEFPEYLIKKLEIVARDPKRWASPKIKWEKV